MDCVGILRLFLALSLRLCFGMIEFLFREDELLGLLLTLTILIVCGLALARIEVTFGLFFVSYVPSVIGMLSSCTFSSAIDSKSLSIFYLTILG